MPPPGRRGADFRRGRSGVLVAPSSRFRSLVEGESASKLRLLPLSGSCDTTLRNEEGFVVLSLVDFEGDDDEDDCFDLSDFSLLLLLLLLLDLRFLSLSSLTFSADDFGFLPFNLVGALSAGMPSSLTLQVSHSLAFARKTPKSWTSPPFALPGAIFSVFLRLLRCYAYVLY